MASLTVRNIEDEVESALRLRAARRGISLESEIRNILRDAAKDTPRALECESERERRVRTILDLGRPSAEPFDLKAYSDALSDGIE